MDAMAEAAQAGKIRAVGVGNYSPRQMEKAHKRLARHGLPLASNQVRYSLLDRHPEASGLLEACRGLNVALIAYSPLGQGVLTGKYTGQDAITPPFPRGFSGAFRTANCRRSSSSRRCNVPTEGFSRPSWSRTFSSGWLALGDRG